MGVKTGSVASAVDFLCKIEISKFDMSLFKETLQDVGTLHL